MDAIGWAGVASGAAALIGVGFNAVRGYGERLKEAEAKGRENMRFQTVVEKVDNLEKRMNENECATTELEKALSKQEFLLNELLTRISEIASDVKELTKQASARREQWSEERRAQWNGERP